MNDRVRTILAQLRRKLVGLYGDRLVKLVLLGSQARGDARPDSDIDVLVVLKGPVHPSSEIHRVSPLTAAISLANNVVIACVFVPEERYDRGHGPLVLNVKAEGVPV